MAENDKGTIAPLPPGQAKKAAKKIISRKERTAAALAASSKALGIVRERQTTDSNN